jgi:hypothetical protein
MIVSISFDTEGMPRLNPQQREQAIGRLQAEQPARVIANDFNCNVPWQDGSILDCWQLIDGEPYSTDWSLMCFSSSGEPIPQMLTDH